MEFPAGDRIEQLRVVREIGHGGMGCVYEVVAGDEATHLALKAFTLDHGNREFLKKRFLAEAKILSRLSHPRLVHVHELGVDEPSGTPYYVMDLVRSASGEPETLEDVRRAGKVTEAKALQWFRRSCVRLTEVLREGGIDRTKGRFRDYLASMTRRLLVDRYRAEQSRIAALDRAANPVRNRETLADGAPGALVDAAWQVAVRKAAIEHVLTQTAVSEQSKRGYRAVVPEQRPLKEVASEFGITYAAAKQIKSRLDRAVESILGRYGATAG